MPRGGLFLAAGIAGSKAFLACVGGTASSPLASFTFAAVPPPAGKPIRPDQPVAFHSTSVPGDRGAALVDQAWDLDGDGTFENTTASPSRSFDAPGDYTVRLRVSDDRGLAATTSIIPADAAAHTQHTRPKAAMREDRSHRAAFPPPRRSRALLVAPSASSAASTGVTGDDQPNSW